MTPLIRSQIEFMVGATNRPFSWGEEDCALFLANWWRHVHGTDPGARLRGTYSTAEEAHAVIAANRGLQRLVARAAREVGALRTRTPKLGDFGLIVHNGLPFGAICVCPKSTPDSWVVRAATSVAFVHRPRVLCAWALSYEDR